MPQCIVCHSEQSREERVDQVFNLGDRYVLVAGVPATVCVDCGERWFSGEAAERCRVLVHEGPKAERTMPMEVFDYAPSKADSPLPQLGRRG